MSDQPAPTGLGPYEFHRETALRCAIDMHRTEGGAVGGSAENIVSAANTFLAFLQGGDAPVPQAEAATPAATTTRRKPKETPAAAGSTSQPDAATSAPPKTEPSKSGGDEADLRARAKAITLSIAGKRGRQTAVDLLAKFDATSASDMPADKLEGYLPLAQRVLDGEEITDVLGEAEGDDDLG